MTAKKLNAILVRKHGLPARAGGRARTRMATDGSRLPAKIAENKIVLANENWTLECYCLSTHMNILLSIRVSLALRYFLCAHTYWHRWRKRGTKKQRNNIAINVYLSSCTRNVRPTFGNGPERSVRTKRVYACMYVYDCECVKSFLLRCSYFAAAWIDQSH